jgi:Rhodopirellula transposase DDE domain
MHERVSSLKKKLKVLLPNLDERQRRILVAAEAEDYGYGGVSLLSELTGMSRQTIHAGMKDLQVPAKKGGVRDAGGGRKKLTELNPKIVNALESIVESAVRGDPEATLRWTSKSLRKIQECLLEKGFYVSHQTVRNLLRQQEYTLQSNFKSTEGKRDHPDRNGQFEYIGEISKKYLKRQMPVISVDTKKKELIGNYKNNGREWRRSKKYTHVLSHDFPDPKVPKAVPYGVYDLSDNKGWVNVGISSDTAQFAVESIRQWWWQVGRKRYRGAKKLLICADSGGSNGYRIRLWKYEIQKFAREEKIDVTICHFPPGTSKWNKVEHRLFSYISKNWRGRPLVTYRTVIQLIASTTTKTGLTVEARLDRKKYKNGIKISDDDMEKIKLHPHDFHGEWNYTIKSH